MSSAYEDDVDVDAGSSSIDWRQRYLQVKALLDETRQELDEFQVSSQELEEELERELQRTERAHEELSGQVRRLEVDKEDWKIKYIDVNASHEKLQQDLNGLRQLIVSYKSHIVELELGNDDLERNERAATESFRDMENKYSRILEEKTIMEGEIQEKMTLREENQRLKDELRDMTAEMAAMLRRQTITPPSNLLSSSTSSIALPQRRIVSTPAPEINPLGISGTRSSRPVPGTAGGVANSKSRGLTMVTDMRARTKALQAKIGTTLPRMRVGSGALNRSTSISAKAGLSSSTSSRRTHRASIDSSTEGDSKKRVGWVIINEALTPKATKTRPSQGDDTTIKATPPRGRMSFDSASTYDESSEAASSRRSSFASSVSVNSAAKPPTPPQAAAPPSAFRESFGFPAPLTPTKANATGSRSSSAASSRPESALDSSIRPGGGMPRKGRLTMVAPASPMFDHDVEDVGRTFDAGKTPTKLAANSKMSAIRHKRSQTLSSNSHMSSSTSTSRMPPPSFPLQSSTSKRISGSGIAIRSARTSAGLSDSTSTSLSVKVDGLPATAHRAKRQSFGWPLASSSPGGSVDAGNSSMDSETSFLSSSRTKSRVPALDLVRIRRVSKT